MALDPQQIAALPDPVRRRFLRVYRAFSVGLFLVLAGITAAVLVPGRPRLYGLIGIGAGALIIAGAFLFAFKVGYRVVPVPPPSGDGAPPPVPPEA